MTGQEAIGARLREERERLNGTQDAWAAAGGVHRNSQRSYEQGKTPTDSGYLTKIGAIGADINYILTGRRGGPDTGDQAEELAGELGLIKLPEIDIAVGMGVAFPDEAVIESVDRYIPEEWVRQFTDAPASRLAIRRASNC